MPMTMEAKLVEHILKFPLSKFFVFLPKIRLTDPLSRFLKGYLFKSSSTDSSGLHLNYSCMPLNPDKYIHGTYKVKRHWKIACSLRKSNTNSETFEAAAYFALSNAIALIRE